MIWLCRLDFARPTHGFGADQPDDSCRAREFQLRPLAMPHDANTLHVASEIQNPELDLHSCWGTRVEIRDHVTID